MRLFLQTPTPPARRLQVAGFAHLLQRCARGQVEAEAGHHGHNGQDEGHNGSRILSWH